MTDDLLAKATPRPWRIAEPWTDAIAIEAPRGYDPDGSIPPIVCWMTRGGDNEANAALIVAAVNAYTGREREDGARWRDKKNGSTYTEIGRGRLRCFNTDTLADRVVIYRADEDGSLWVRPVWEFEDGRFELLSERSEPSPSAQSPAPIDMILFCPMCCFQHVDAPEPEKGWINPPHKTHECHRCAHLWRPASVPTNGVADIPLGSTDTLGPIREEAGIIKRAALDEAVKALRAIIEEEDLDGARVITRHALSRIAGLTH